MKHEKELKKKPVDWNQVRRRMEAARGAAEKNWSRDEAEKRRILKTRAKALAAEPEKKEPGEELEIVEFLLSREKYGVESRHVREVSPLRDYTPIPCAPPFVLGIVNVRGEILSIIDIRKFFDLPEQGLGDLNRVIILSSGEMAFGILADAILGVRTIPLEELNPPPPTFTGVRREYLKGIVTDSTAVLDGEMILSDRGIVVNEFV